jgi:hypothetical protein
VGFARLRWFDGLASVWLSLLPTFAKGCTLRWWMSPFDGFWPTFQPFPNVQIPYTPIHLYTYPLYTYTLHIAPQAFADCPLQIGANDFGKKIIFALC